MIFASEQELAQFTYNFIARGAEYIKRPWEEALECLEHLTQLELGSEQRAYSLFYLPDLRVFPRLRQLSLQYCSQLRQLQVVNGIEYIRQWEAQQVLTVYLAHNTAQRLLLTQNYAPRTLVLGEGADWRVLAATVNGAIAMRLVDTVVLEAPAVDALIEAAAGLEFPRGVALRLPEGAPLGATQRDALAQRGFALP